MSAVAHAALDGRQKRGGEGRWPAQKAARAHGADAEGGGSGGGRRRGDEGREPSDFDRTVGKRGRRG